jgi:DNA-binding MarR family transcriptional regulator
MKTTLKSPINFCFALAKFQTKLSRRLDAGLGGLGYNELIILYHLNQVKEEGMRRIDLAEKVGLTASGVTRLLLPMEKVGLVQRKTTKTDARVSAIAIAPGGLTRLNEGLERLTIFCEDLIPNEKEKQLEEVISLIKEIEKNI